MLVSVSELRIYGAVKETLEVVCKDMVNSGLLVVIITKEMHSMANGRGKAPINGVMEKYIKEIGKKVNEMVVGYKHGQMDRYTTEIGWTGNNKVRAN